MGKKEFVPTSGWFTEAPGTGSAVDLSADLSKLSRGGLDSLVSYRKDREFRESTNHKLALLGAQEDAAAPF